MRAYQKLAVMALAAVSIAAGPAAADPGQGRGKNKDRAHHVSRDVGHCPPGLAKKNPPCVPPGQARHQDDRHYGVRVGDILRVGDYVVIRDPRRANLETRDNWRYYRDGDRAYRVDSDTRRILAVINLINAFTN
ncbi:MAG: hypothetical protein Q4G49_14860 [Paracoccus sp. (in: a-proteobacteria)]|nr:hypothetical protein [Paracoccus sp. (in: a-proteobacteria)]